MSIETGVLISKTGEPIYWHLPPGRNSGYLPDSHILWEKIWLHRKSISGFAHSHPGGMASPSWEDITTFSGVERALGARLEWLICTVTRLVVCRFRGPDKYNYSVEPWIGPEPIWLEQLRDLSYDSKQKEQEAQL